MSVQDHIELDDDSFQRAFLIASWIFSVEIVFALEFCMDLTNEMISPLGEHALRYVVIVRLLEELKVFELSWETECFLVGVQ